MKCKELEKGIKDSSIEKGNWITISLEKLRQENPGLQNRRLLLNRFKVLQAVVSRQRSKILLL